MGPDAGPPSIADAPALRQGRAAATTARRRTGPAAGHHRSAAQLGGLRAGSQRGDISRRRRTTSTVRRPTCSTSSSVVKRWRLNRTEECARSALAPSAATTYDGSKVAEVHAEPEASAASRLRARSTDSPSTCAKERFRSEEHTSELQSPCNLVCRLLLEKKNAALNSSRFVLRTPSSSMRSTSRWRAG